MNTYPTNSIELGSCKPGMPLWNRAASWWPDFHHTYLRGPITTIGAVDALVRLQNAGVYGPANEIVYCVERPKPGLMLGVCISGDVGYEFQIIMPDPYRSHECHNGHKWDADVEWGKTFNLSGEVTQYCPECGSRSALSSAWNFRGSAPTPGPHDWNTDLRTLGERVAQHVAEGGEFEVCYCSHSPERAVNSTSHVGEDGREITFFADHECLEPVLRVCERNDTLAFFSDHVRFQSWGQAEGAIRFLNPDPEPVPEPSVQDLVIYALRQAEPSHYAEADECARFDVVVEELRKVGVITPEQERDFWEHRNKP